MLEQFSQLALELKEVAVLHGDFVLRSGRRSSYYLDKYRFTTSPAVLKHLAGAFATHISEDVTLLAGAELGGIPLVTALSMESALPMVFVRNQKKEYGTAQQLEGPISAEDKVFLVEDICTTGGQILEAAAAIESTGAKVVHIVSTIDRLEGARESIEAKGYRYSSLFTVKDLGLV